MYQNQLFFDDFQKVFKAKISESDLEVSSRRKSVDNHHYHVGFWLKRILVKFNLQYRLH